MKPLAIVGNGPTRDNPRHNNMGWDVWAMNNHPFLWQKRVTALFEMHPDVLEADRYTAEYKDWLKHVTFPVYMHRVHPDIPSSVQFPREAIAQEYPVLIEKGDLIIKDFYAETTAYMLALALYFGYQIIELYGIDLNKRQYLPHRDSIFLWLGYLQANRVRVIIPEESPLMDEALYPFNHK